MRSIWKGTVSFGLVSIPIKVVSATENHSVSFHQVHTDDGGRIRYRKVCELDEQEVPREEIGRGFETEEGRTILLTDDDMAALPLPTAKTVEILGFVPAEDIDPIQLDRSYFLAADGRRADKPYVLLREALKRSGKVAVAKLALRARESLGMLRVYEDALALHTMLWPDEIRSASGVAPEGEVAVRDQELDLADTLMETLGELDWSDLRDEYREALEELVRAKAEGVEPPPEELRRRTEAGGGKLVDLMSVLERSVQEARGGRDAGEGGEATVHELAERRAGERPAEKTASKKAASKKTASRKPAGTKKAAKKSTAKQPAAKSTKQSGAKSTKKAASKSTKTDAAKKTAAKKAARPRKTA
ncbi:non-homologous end joining protein Ku [Streptomyces reniochalinae]|uniref:Non-homologous end joining protein Ku n=1 Tax=Streptomyces reniochalinae TaxID=2250578 RepID=A0A367EBS5_9ACTN|nr:Ku protein [Streptomyces reniochalinae]RCG14777.1 Ku protein [Streptomyces reniochalinae]